MCMSADTPPTAAPMPLQPPPPVVKLAGAAGDGTRNDSAALAANRGRSSLRIDKSTNVPGASAGNGLNIPS